MNKEILGSKKLADIMQFTFEERHQEANQRDFGVWRWKGMYMNQHIILDIVDKCEKILDVGGALAPFGFGSEIVDLLDRDILGRPIKHNNLTNLQDGQADMLFSSHCLEHFVDTRFALSCMVKAVKPGGYIVLHLPSVRGTQYWHPVVKPEHYCIFAVSSDKLEYIDKVFLIDKALSKDCRIMMAQNVDDNSLLVIGRKNG